MMIHFLKKLTSRVLLALGIICLGTSGARSAVEVIPDDLYHQAWQIIKSNYADKNFNGQVWESWEHRYKGKLKTEEDAYLAIGTMVASLGYSHNALVPRTPTLDSESELRPAREPSDILFARVSPKRSLPNLGYIRFKAFKSQKCQQDLYRAFIDLQLCDGIVLDLRNNEGELLSVAINCLLPFFSQPQTGKLVLGKQPLLKDKAEKHDASTVLYRFDNDAYVLRIVSLSNVYFNKPLVVLANHETAAAAVMFAAALKENGRALVVGTSADKGPKVIETIYHLEDGTTLKIPTAHWFSPLSNDFSKVDFPPDVQFKLTAKDKRDGKGAWWKASANDMEFTDASTSEDLQLLKAEEVLNDLIKQSAH